MVSTLLLLQTFYILLPETTWVSWYQKKHSPTHTYPDHHSCLISFLHLMCHKTINISYIHTRYTMYMTTLDWRKQLEWCGGTSGVHSFSVRQISVDVILRTACTYQNTRRYQTKKLTAKQKTIQQLQVTVINSRSVMMFHNAGKTNILFNSHFFRKTRASQHQNSTPYSQRVWTKLPGMQTSIFGAYPKPG